MENFERLIGKALIKTTDRFLERHCNSACIFFWYQPIIPDCAKRKYKKGL